MHIAAYITYLLHTYHSVKLKGAGICETTKKKIVVGVKEVKSNMNMCMFEANLGARDLTAADYTDGSMKPPAKIPRKVSTQKI